MDFGAISEKIRPYYDSFMELLQKTQLPEQIQNVDYVGLSTNPWFLVPFILLIGYLIYKKAFRGMIILAILIGLWFASGTEYMQNLVVGDQLQVSKVLPVLFGGAAVIGLLVYIMFGRSD